MWQLSILWKQNCTKIESLYFKISALKWIKVYFTLYLTLIFFNWFKLRRFIDTSLPDPSNTISSVESIFIFETHDWGEVGASKGLVSEVHTVMLRRTQESEHDFMAKNQSETSLNNHFSTAFMKLYILNQLDH